MPRFPFFTAPAWRGLRLGLACAGAAWLLTFLPFCCGLEDWLLDTCFIVRGTRPTSARVLLIGLDNATLDELKKPLVYLSPELAEVVTHVRKQNAAAIGIDLLIPDSLNDLPEIETPGAAGDAGKLGEAILKAGNVTLPEWFIEGQWQRPLVQWRDKTFLHPEPTDLGFVGVTADRDQFVRRQQFLVRDDSQPGRPQAVPHLALALFARSRGEAFAWDDERRVLRVGAEDIVLDDEQKLRINFVGPPGTFPVLSFRDVLRAGREGRALPEMAGAIVLIGATSRTEQDYHPCPFSNAYGQLFLGRTAGFMAGTEMDAHILATLQDRAYIVTPPWLTPLPWLLLFGAGFGWLFARLSLEAGLLGAVLPVLAWIGLALAAFTLANWRVEVLGMVLLAGLCYTATFALRWRSMRRMLGVVKSEAIALALEADPRRLALGGEEREVTVLFADIRSFTGFAENHTAPQVVALLNTYYTAIVPLIEEHGGTLNQYMGDGILVIYGAPVRYPDHARRAVRTATALIQRVHELRDRWAEQGIPGLRIGIGIHTGMAVVGSVGSPRRLDYTAIGDTVNIAARIENETKRLGAEVLISAQTCAALSAEERERLGVCPQSEPAQVRGKSQPLQLHRIGSSRPSGDD